MVIIDGKKISNEICQELKTEIVNLKQHQITPKLVIIQVGDVAASNIYVRNKLRLAKTLEVIAVVQKYPDHLSNDELIDIIHKLNNDPYVHGILVQMPLPKHIDEATIIANINPVKDVDCFHLENIGKL
jgi:methylenetetrahydrofolate dehydrogenase (NADP+)/methenyltetrahydrofolate cyclohydrolase